jgi:hypothetical protein
MRREFETNPIISIIVARLDPVGLQPTDLIREHRADEGNRSED